MKDSAGRERRVDLPRNRASAETPFIVFCSLLCTFLAARLVVAGIYSGWWKLGGFLFVQGRHIHHYNYGILLLAVVGFLALTGVDRRRRWITAILYGIALGLTFDEFAMWLRLEDAYYHRLSYDAVVAVASLLLIVASFGAFRDRLRKRREAHAYSFPGGAILFREGDSGHDAYYVEQGKIRISKQTGSGTRTLAIIGEGEFVGEIALFADCPRSATAEAVGDVRLRRLNRKNLLYSIELHPELGIMLIRSLAERLIATNEQLAGSRSPPTA